MSEFPVPKADASKPSATADNTVGSSSSTVHAKPSINMAIMDLTQLTAFDRAQIVLDRKLMTSPSDAKAEVASVINNELKKAAARRAAAQAAQLPPTPKTQEPDL